MEDVSFPRYQEQLPPLLHLVVLEVVWDKQVVEQATTAAEAPHHNRNTTTTYTTFTTTHSKTRAVIVVVVAVEELEEMEEEEGTRVPPGSLKDAVRTHPQRPVWFEGRVWSLGRARTSRWCYETSTLPENNSWHYTHW